MEWNNGTCTALETAKVDGIQMLSYNSKLYIGLIFLLVCLMKTSMLGYTLEIVFAFDHCFVTSFSTQYFAILIINNFLLHLK